MADDQTTSAGVPDEADEAAADDEGAPEADGGGRAPAGSLRAWLGGAPLPKPALIALGLALPMLLVIVNALRVRGFTVDDAYISFRYAENLARGEGLVYNAGERVEGYTNFLWTVLLAGAVKLGATAPGAAKVLGGAFACAALVPVYLLSERLRPFSNVPCLATWLLATSFVFTGYAVFGLESPLFLFLTLAGAELFYREEAAGRRFPASGLVFALAALTRPEAPLFLGMLVLWLGDRAFTRRNAARLALFAIPVAAHLLWRHAYYGAWVPNTLVAKTGDFAQQIQGGGDYLRKYANHAGPSLWLGIGSVAWSIVHRRREGLAIASIAVLFGVYVLFVGGDWMPYYRFLAPAEPFAFLLVDDAARAVAERRERVASLSIGVFGLITAVTRAGTLAEAQRGILQNDKAFWDDAAGRTAAWLVEHGEPGPIAIADIGFVGYRTGFPVVDMLGLLAPEISSLPGGYTRKIGAGYTDAIFARNPRYFVIIATGTDCKGQTVPSSRASYGDARFKRDYRLRHPVALKKGGAWCIFEKTAYP